MAAPFQKWRPHRVTQTVRRRLSVAKVPDATAFTSKGFNPAKPVRVSVHYGCEARSRAHVSPPAALVGYQLGGSAWEKPRKIGIQQNPIAARRSRAGSSWSASAQTCVTVGYTRNVWHRRSASCTSVCALRLPSPRWNVADENRAKRRRAILRSYSCFAFVSFRWTMKKTR